MTVPGVPIQGLESTGNPVVCVTTRVPHGLLVVGIGYVEVGCVKCGLHLLLRTNENEIHHVSQILELVIDAARQAIDVLTKT